MSKTSDIRNILFYGDNLDVLRRHIADASVDLIARSVRDRALRWVLSGRRRLAHKTIEQLIDFVMLNVADVLLAQRVMELADGLTDKRNTPLRDRE